LDRGLDKPLILVAAGAGFGKTTLVSSWLEELAGRTSPAAPMPIAWLTLDENDGDLVLFLRYFLRAVRTVQPGACPQTDTLLYALRQPRPQLLFATISNELAELPSELLLVLDDYSAVHSSAVDEFLATLLRNWPQPLHLVLITRYDPPLPLPALRARGDIVELRSRDLRFSPAETASYLNLVLLTPPDDKTITAVQARAEGWIAGIKLATLSLDTGTSATELVAVLASSDVNVTAYLADEVFSNQPPAIQAFLLQTSILDHFCAALCTAVLEDRMNGSGKGRSGAAWSAGTCIEWLVRSNLFTVGLDERSEWYRYHHLFRNMLRRRAGTELTEKKLRGLHRRAALWFAGQHRFDEALRHALAAGDIDLAVRVAEEGLPDALNREDWLTLERWLRLLPPALVESRPWLLLMKAWIMQFTWQLGTQVRVLNQIEALLDQSEEDHSTGAMQSAASGASLRVHIALLRAQHAFFRNQPSLALGLLAAVIPNMPQNWAYVRGGAMLYTGVSMQAAGQGAAAERLLLDSFEQYPNKADPYGLRLLMPLCFNYFAQGKLEQVRQTADTMLRLCVNQHLPTMQSWAEYFLGLAHYEWNQHAAAEAHFAVVAERRHVALMAVVRDAMHQLALLQQLRGDSSGAWGTLDQLSELELEQNGREDETTRGLRSRLLLMQGDLESAGRWADAFTAPVPEQPLLWLANPHLVKARILLARQHETDLEAAQQILEALQVQADQSYNTRFSVEILALLAVSHAGQGCEAAAQAALERACELARPGGFVRLFVELGPAILALLAGLPGQNASVRRLLAACGGAPQGVTEGSAAAVRRNGAAPAPLGEQAPSADGPLLVEPLTPRELEVLALLGEPLSPKEIARKLDISYGTLKRHVANVYGKLGVTTRWDAVAQAKALRLLPTG
jgi:LuxR family maltose regulon positive regulatory protein